MTVSGTRQLATFQMVMPARQLHTLPEPPWQQVGCAYADDIVHYPLSEPGDVCTPGELLLEFPQSIVNWGEFASANNFKGWLDPAVPLCQWTGVQCDSNGRVTALCALPPNASKMHTALRISALSAAMPT